MWNTRHSLWIFFVGMALLAGCRENNPTEKPSEPFRTLGYMILAGTGTGVRGIWTALPILLRDSRILTACGLPADTLQMQDGDRDGLPRGSMALHVQCDTQVDLGTGLTLQITLSNTSGGPATLLFQDDNDSLFGFGRILLMDTLQGSYHLQGGDSLDVQATVQFAPVDSGGGWVLGGLEEDSLGSWLAYEIQRLTIIVDPGFSPLQHFVLHPDSLVVRIAPQPDRVEPFQGALTFFVSGNIAEIRRGPVGGHPEYAAQNLTVRLQSLQAMPTGSRGVVQGGTVRMVVMQGESQATRESDIYAIIEDGSTES